MRRPDTDEMHARCHAFRPYLASGRPILPATLGRPRAEHRDGPAGGRRGGRCGDRRAERWAERWAGRVVRSRGRPQDPSAGSVAGLARGGPHVPGAEKIPGSQVARTGDCVCGVKCGRGQHGGVVGCISDGAADWGACAHEPMRRFPAARALHRSRDGRG